MLARLAFHSLSLSLPPSSCKCLLLLSSRRRGDRGRKSRLKNIDDDAGSTHTHSPDTHAGTTEEFSVVRRKTRIPLLSSSFRRWYCSMGMCVGRAGERKSPELSFSSCRVGGNRIRNRENEILSPEKQTSNRSRCSLRLLLRCESREREGGKEKESHYSTFLSPLSAPIPLSVATPIFPHLSVALLGGTIYFKGGGGR